jgi:hypothetical protein
LSTRAGARLAEEGKRQVKMTIARMKFAIGPAATMAARAPTFFVMETARPLLLGHAGERFAEAGVEASDLSPKNFIAAEWDRGDLPARTWRSLKLSVPGSKPSENVSTSRPPTGRLEVAEFMEEHDDGQDEQKGNDSRRAHGPTY